MAVPPDSPPPAGPHAAPSQPPLLIAPRQGYHSGLLITMVLLGIGYATWIHLHQTITGDNLWDAIIGVLLGIYICSRPITNLMDMIYTQNICWQDLMKRAGVMWLVMNFITTFTGWATIVLGATRMVRPE